MSINEKLKSISKQHKRHFREFYKKVEANTNTIESILRTYSIIPISRVKILGTIGIKSPLETQKQPDFNLVVFANFQTHQFKDFLQNLEACLVRNGDKFNTEFTTELETLASIHLRMKDVTTSEAFPSRTVSYMTFELVPTMNFLSPAEEQLGSRNMEETQAERALQFISQLPTKMRNITSNNYSLSERYVTFAERQSHFVHQVIILAKLWNRMVSWDGPQRLLGRTKIIEVVAISVAVEEEEMAKRQFRQKSLLCAFDTFLQKFLHFDGMMNEVPKYDANVDLILDLPYQKYVDQTLALEDGPVILDPVNPFNNLPKYIPSYMKAFFKAHAKTTKYKLKIAASKTGDTVKSLRELETCFGI